MLYEVITKPLGQRASVGELAPLETELRAISTDLEKSELYRSLKAKHFDTANPSHAHMNALKVPCIAERIVVYLFAEQNLLSAEQTRGLVERLGLNREYLFRRLRDNKRPLEI